MTLLPFYFLVFICISPIFFFLSLFVKKISVENGKALGLWNVLKKFICKLSLIAESGASLSV
jgi:hypothetical protein